MKKILLILIVIIGITMMGGIVYNIYNQNIKDENIYSNILDKKLKDVKNAMTEIYKDTYFVFERDNQKYVLIGFAISSYDNPKKSKIIIEKADLKDNILNLDIDYKPVYKEYDLPEGTIIDDYSHNMIFEVLPIDTNIEKVIVREKEQKYKYEYEYIKFNGGVITKEINYKNSLGRYFLYGYVNSKGQTVLPTEYDLVEEIDQNNIKVKKDNLTALYNKEGQKKIDYKYDSICSFKYKENTFMVTKENKTAVVDENDNIIYNWVDGIILERFSHSPELIMKIDENGKILYGIINEYFKIVEPIECDKITRINEKEFTAKKGEQYWKIYF